MSWRKKVSGRDAPWSAHLKGGMTGSRTRNRCRWAIWRRWARPCRGRCRSTDRRPMKGICSRLLLGAGLLRGRRGAGEVQSHIDRAGLVINPRVGSSLSEIVEQTLLADVVEEAVGIVWLERSSQLESPDL